MLTLITKPEKIIFRKVQINKPGLPQDGLIGQIIRYAKDYRTKSFNGLYWVRYKWGCRYTESVFNRNELIIL